MMNIYDNEKFFNKYADMARSKFGLDAAGEWQQLRNLFPDLKNKTVLDLGCGYGWHCDYAVKCGAKYVLGIDGSSKMIDEAKKRHYNDKITYQLTDLLNYSYPLEKFDLVISNLVLHYIEDLKDIYMKVYQTLTVGGTFIFNIEHPTFTGSVNEDWIYDSDGKPKYWPVDRYFYTGERETSFLGETVVKYHHTLTQILNELIHVGFTIQNIEEVMPPENMLDLPGMKDELRRPMMLLVKAIKE